MKTMRVTWKGDHFRDKFGDGVYVINADEFDSEIHEEVEPELKRRETKIEVKDPENKTEDPVEIAITNMHAEDPEKENEDYWLKDGRPEVKEIVRRIPEDVEMSAKIRDEAYEKWSQAQAG